MTCGQFIFKPGPYDDDFRRLDGEIDNCVRSLPGFDRVGKRVAPEGDVVNAMYYFADRGSVAMLGLLPQHRKAKGTAGTAATASRPTAMAASLPRGRLPAQ